MPQRHFAAAGALEGNRVASLKLLGRQHLCAQQ
jgi:hypothetical protein